MSIKTFFKRVFTKEAGIPYSWLNDVSFFEALGNTETIDYYKSWVYACVNKIAGGIAKSEWVLYQLKGKEIVEIEEHELLTLLQKVNPFFTEYDFKELNGIFGEMYGSCPWILFRGSDGKPNEIWNALPPNLKPKKKDTFGNIILWEYEISGSYKKEFKTEDVIYLRYPSPANPNEGFSPLSALKITADLDGYMEKWNANLMKNDARPPFVIEYPGSLSPKDKKSLQKMFHQQYQGFDNAYKKALILTKDAKAKPLGMPPKELEFKDTQIINRDKICAILGVPASILGLDKGVNRASMEQAERNFGKYTLDPKVRKITEQLNEFLIPQFDDKLWLGYRPLVREDREQKLEEHKAGVNNWLTINEIRKEEGKEDIEGGDYIYLPIGLAPQVGGEGKKGYIKLKKKTPNGLNLKLQSTIRKKILGRTFYRRKRAEAIAEKVSKKIFTSKRVVLKLVEKKSFKLSEEKRSKFYEIRMKREKREEELWRKAFAKIFKKQKEQIIENLKKTKKDLVSDVMLNKEKEVKTTMTIIEPLYYSSLVAGAEDAAALVGMGTVDIAKIPEVQKWVGRITEKYATEITGTTIDNLTKILKDGVREGEGVYELGNKVEDYFGTIAPNRADMIARTETARATTEAHAISWEEMGFDKMEWLLAPDACDLCIAESSRKWDVNTIKGMIPVHPNCKCDFTPTE